MASAAEQLAANININAFSKATDLHKRLWFTVIALIVYRLGTFIPIPGVNVAYIASMLNGSAKGILGMVDMFSGGAVQHGAIFALNVMPYISASIIVQLLGTVYPPWEKLRKEGGEAGRKQMNQYTRYLTVVLALFQSFGLAVGFNRPDAAYDPGIFFVISTMATLTGGTLFLMWLGEQITARGIGNGVSLIIMAGIVARVPAGIVNLLSSARAGSLPGGGAMLMVIAVGAVGIIGFIVFMERSQRRILVNYPKRQMGNRMFGGETSFLPLKLNTAGVIPPIFASSLLLMPGTALGFLSQQKSLPSWASWAPVVVGQLQHGQPTFMIVYALMIVFFSFFYTSIVFNPDDTAENLRKYGGFLPGIRPGKNTAAYLDYVLTRLTVIGAAYITLICLIPEFLMAKVGNNLAFGGTSILIMVTVTIDTWTQIQSHLLQHQYEGLIKKSRLRGGRRK